MATSAAAKPKPKKETAKEKRERQARELLAAAEEDAPDITPRAPAASAETYDPRTFQQRAYESASDPALIPSDRIKRQARRETLLQNSKRIVNVDDLIFNKKNHYPATSIEALAAIIQMNGVTSPIIVREIDNPDPKTAEDRPLVPEVVDGERRVRAHRLLREETGDPAWGVIECVYFPYGLMDDVNSEFMLNSFNLGHRHQLDAQRIVGTAAMAETIRLDRDYNPLSKYKGRNTADILSEMIGISPRQVSTYMRIANKLVVDGIKLFEAGGITLSTAKELASLDPDRQIEVIDKIASGEIPKNKARAYVLSLIEGGPTEDPVAHELTVAWKHICKALKLREGNRALEPEWHELFQTAVDLLDPDSEGAVADLSITDRRAPKNLPKARS